MPCAFYVPTWIRCQWSFRRNICSLSTIAFLLSKRIADAVLTMFIFRCVFSCVCKISEIDCKIHFRYENRYLKMMFCLECTATFLQQSRLSSASGKFCRIALGIHRRSIDSKQTFSRFNVALNSSRWVSAASRISVQNSVQFGPLHAPMIYFLLNSEKALPCANRYCDRHRIDYIECRSS